MLNWKDLEHIHVIKRLKEILGSLWSIDIVFSDDRGNLKNINKAGSTYELLKKEPLQEEIKKIIVKSIEDLQSSQKPSAVVKWEQVGFDVAIFPINIENDFLGSLSVFGFCSANSGGKPARLKEIEKSLSRLGFESSFIGPFLEKVAFLEKKDEFYLFSLCQLITQEIITLHMEIIHREARIEELNKKLGSKYKYDNMVGKSKKMRDLYSVLDRICNAESTIMIYGENGTGKELIARSIHYKSPRAQQNFIVQNCSSFNDNLLESELFGHVKGSFTGAIKDKKGLFEVADKGTLFLDEIGDTSPQMQVKLLRVLQDGIFTPVGSTESKKIDVRIIAATNKNLKKMVEGETFREDLYYRLNVINVCAPPLSERKDDVPLLVDYFLEKFLKDQPHLKARQVTQHTMEKLLDYNWPGNVRELENEVERFVVLSGDATKITPDMLSPKIFNQNKVNGVRLHGKLKDALEDLEKRMILEGLRRTGWNKSKLAKELGISRAGLIIKVDKYQLEKRKAALKSG